MMAFFGERNEMSSKATLEFLLSTVEDVSVDMPEDAVLEMGLKSFPQVTTRASPAHAVRRSALAAEKEDDVVGIALHAQGHEHVERYSFSLEC